MSEFDRRWFDDRLEAFVDGELPEHEREQIEELLRADDYAAGQMTLARMVKTQLSDMPWEVCPSEVTRHVLETARREARRNVKRRILDTLHSTWSTVFRPALAVGVFVALIVVGTRIGGDRTPPTSQEEIAATPEDVQKALEQAKWTLAYLSQIGRDAGQSIRREVIEERVARPMKQAVSSAFPKDTPVQ